MTVAPSIPLRRPDMGDTGRRAWRKVLDPSSGVIRWVPDWRIVSDPDLDPLLARWQVLVAPEQEWQAWKTNPRGRRCPPGSKLWGVDFVLVEGDPELP